MIHFNCRACNQPLVLSAVGTWCSGEPLCGPACLEQIGAHVLEERTTNVDTHRAAYPELLQSIGAYVRTLIGEMDRLAFGSDASDRAYETAAAGVGALIGGPLVGAAFGAAADNRHERILVWLSAQIHQLSEMSVDLVRRSMAMHAKGVALPPTIFRAIQLIDQLDADGDDSLLRSELEVIFDELQSAYRAWSHMS